jgi:hypothetical protein
LLRAHPACKVEQVLKGIAFNIVFNLAAAAHEFREIEHILRAYMTLVRTRVHREASRTGVQHYCAGTHNARYAQGA